MAPKRTFRTYSRGNNSSVGCVEAFNILFAKNLTQRKLYGKTHKGRTKLKFEIKELPTKIRTVLKDETSFRVNINDTFDNLLNDPCKGIKSNSLKVNLVSNKSSVSCKRDANKLGDISPMLQKLRSYSNKTGGKNTLSSWFNEPTPPGDRITNLLEIEKTKSDLKKQNKSKIISKSGRNSPILLRSRKQIGSGCTSTSDGTKHGTELQGLSKDAEVVGNNKTIPNQNCMLNPIFTNSVREHILIHSSTPFATSKNQRLIGQPISPINTWDEVKNCIVESLDEIRNWNLSLPNSETFDCKGTNNKTSGLKSESSQNLSFNLEDFEFFLEQFKSESLKANKFENDLKNRSSTIEEFEKFHKKLISSAQGEMIKNISLKEFENFYQSNKNEVSFSRDSFFDFPHKPLDFVTHRKHKLSQSSRLRHHSRSSKKFNLKNLVVMLDNNLVNYTDCKFRQLEKPKCALMNGLIRKQLTVNLTKLSLDKLKLAIDQSQSRNPQSRRNVNRFKACRKYSANWNTQMGSKLGSKSVSTNNINPEGPSLNSVDNSPSELKSCKKLSRNFSRNITRSVHLKIGEVYNKKESSPQGISNQSKFYCDTNEKYTEFYYSTSSVERDKQLPEMDQINISASPELHLVKPDVGQIIQIEKKYVSKILLASSIEVHDQQSSLSKINPESPSDYSVLSTVTRRRLRSFTRNSSFEKQNVKSQQRTPVSNHRKEENLAMFSQSNINIIYLAQDIRDSIMNNSKVSTPTSIHLKNNDVRTGILGDKSNGFKSSEDIQIIKRPFSYSGFVEHSSDSISREKSNQLEDSIFKVPLNYLCSQKLPKLRTGKSWRRSLMQHRRESFIDSKENLCYGNTTSIIKLAENNRHSVRISPSPGQPTRLRRKTALQRYASLGVAADDNDGDELSGKSIPEKPRQFITARDMVLNYCSQTEPVCFEKIYPKSLLKDCRKIGEGVYGEVFLHSQMNGSSTVMKIIPIEGDKIVNGERQKTFEEILSEVVIVSQLSNLRKNTSNKTSAFCHVQRICCVRGKYPNVLLDLWHEYANSKGSENDPPDMFGNDQLYIVLDLANGGEDLEAFVFNNALQAVSMFKQVAYALAVGEERLQFEHRDLHWGNILLRDVDKNKKVVFKHKGKVKECLTYGVEVTIIDFTLSRIEYDGVVIFNDLSQDPELFLAEGDYQFDIYRLMQEKNKNDWKKFTPYSNILWLHYVLRKCITALRYKNTKSKVHKKFIGVLRKYENDILNFECVSDFVDNSF